VKAIVSCPADHDARVADTARDDRANLLASPPALGTTNSSHVFSPSRLRLNRTRVPSGEKQGQ
jgi:hypothetical protein